MPNAVIAGYARSPFHLAGKGALARTRPDDLAAAVVKALVQRTGIDAAAIEDLIVGCAFPEGEQGFNVARLIGMIAGLPRSVGGMTVNRFCGSSMSAIHYAVGQIAAGAGELFIAAGVESMSRVPMMGFNPLPNPALAKASQAYIGMGDTAENLASQYGLSRQAQEAFAVASQDKAAAAIAAGKLKDEIVGIETKAGLVDTDGCPRPGTTAETLAGLKPAFSATGTVTAGTSSPLTDGASAVIVASEDYARAHGLPILARIKAMAISGCAPEIMGIGPVESSRKALERAGISVSDLDVIELNEAFASQALACIADLGLDQAKINLDGGAIALGHPLGATGARIVGKAASLLQRTGGKYALATQCIGGGQGIATVLEAI
ncbi:MULTISPECIES: thiolase family protein [Novosphingobium]|uniref:thiolase family protein n=1 Tax=Novosphingobium TaxID=165696 RepID=UPI0007891E1C|nr:MULTISPECIES: thiolase family protein [Novosphingobium]PTR11929.1 acetyl-CoA acyltransferase [Novosphingobium sp. GV055]PUB04969.1 acetyl-CoA acyltransferase [Novosphingobium sp. GV061]PUB21288.1 acetyl-CoA acyltransferase [Novosphingobium sp. GV079]PUB43014.1 acetyl-CoA acyltransferase [Novosphingobium sp. GV027]WQD91658.1 thiolase family protein [Novosphingobium capsulatum]